MAIVGFNFTSMDCKKEKETDGKVKVSNNVAIKSVKQRDLSLGDGQQEALEFIFEYSAKYEPGYGLIKLIGELVYLDKTEKTKEVLASWKERKVIPKEVMEPTINTVLNRCNVQALIMASTVNLPSPIPLPQVHSKPAPQSG